MCVVDFSKFTKKQLKNRSSNLATAIKYLAKVTLFKTCPNILFGFIPKFSFKKSRFHKKLRSDSEEVEEKEINDPDLKEVRMLLSSLRNHLTYKEISSKTYLKAFEKIKAKIDAGR